MNDPSLDAPAPGSGDRLRFRRVLVKLSGELVAGDDGRGIDTEALGRLAAYLAEVHRLGVELSVLMGGGNILRGAKASRRGLSRRAADYMGMTATLINALALEDALQHAGIPARVLSPIGAPQLADLYLPRTAERQLAEGRMVILAGGTGHPYFTTDTAAALRSIELGAEVLLKATKVDGVYSADPMENPAAERFERLGYLDYLQRGLRVMDATAVTLCMDHSLPIIVFAAAAPGGLARILRGEQVGTLIGEE